MIAKWYYTDISGDSIGIHCENSFGTIQGNTIHDNLKYGVYLVGSAPCLKYNTYPNNGVYNIVVGTGTMSYDGTWYIDGGEPYVVLGDVTVAGGGIPTLTLEPGVELKFGSNASLQIATNSPGGQGGLYAVGTPDSQITFTSLSGAVNDWDGISFGSRSDEGGATSTMSYCVVEKAGQTGWNVYCYSTTQPTMTDCEIRHSGDRGIHLYYGDITITNCTIDSNATDGIYCYSGSDATLTNNVISHNGQDGISCNGSNPIIDSIGLSSNGRYGLNLSNSSPVVRNSQIIDNDSCGVFCDGSSQPVIGDTSGLTCELYGNGTFDLYNNTTNTIQARYNFWGQSDSAGIADRIYDCDDDAAKGCVLFSPWSSVDHDVAAVSTLAPTGIVPVGTVITPMAEVKNEGQSPETFPMVFQIGSYCDTAYVTTPLDSGVTDTVTFEPWTADTLLKSVTYVTTCSTALDGDMYTANDTVHGIVTVGTQIEPVIFSISPDFGGNTGAVTATITGDRFQEGATVKLIQTSELDTIVVDSSWTLVLDSTAVIATFDLLDAALGSWNVVVTNPDGGSATFCNGFTVEMGYGNLWIQVLGRGRIRVNRRTEYTISFGNTGNVDAYGVVLTVSGIPANAVLERAFTLEFPPQHEGEDSIDWSEVPVHFEDDGELVMPLYLPAIPANTSSSITIAITVPSITQFNLNASLSPPGIEYFVAKGNAQNCYIAIAKESAYLIIGFALPAECVSNVTSTVVKFTELTIKAMIDRTIDYYDFMHLIGDAAYTGLICAGELHPITNVVLAAWQTYKAWNTISELYNECKDHIRDEWATTQIIRVVSSWNPEDKYGLSGYDSPETHPDSLRRFIPAYLSLTYSIDFWNKEDATAPAQDVLIVDTLDSDLDFSTFAFTEFGFLKWVVPLDSVQQFNMDVDMRPDESLLVNVEGTFEPGTGIITWLFRSLDPITPLPPDDPMAGFLPPMSDSGYEIGWVDFLVDLQPSLPTGTQITNQAFVKFDDADFKPAPKDSPYLNTIDTGAPSSNVDDTLPDTTETLQFTVTWSGSDDSAGSGIASYTIYVSADFDMGTYEPWIADTTGTSAVFTGESEHTYYFYSIARDNVGHVEAPPDSFDAHTTVYVAYICGDVDGNGGNANVADLMYLVEYLFFEGPAPPVLEAANVDGEGGVNVADIIYLVDYIFFGGDEPDCAPIE